MYEGKSGRMSVEKCLNHLFYDYAVVAIRSLNYYTHIAVLLGSVYLSINLMMRMPT